MMNYSKYLESLASPFTTGHTLPKDPSAQTIMILSPHPDDECIVGALPLRLMHENQAHVINVAVTLGSDKKRQKARQKELINACELLEMELVILSDDWKIKEKELSSLIQKYQPQIILAPHLNDVHPTHIKTGKLLEKSLKKLNKLDVLIAWTEFWGQNLKSNVLVEVPIDILALQMEGLAKHEGEIKRNPYHLRLPAWMIDNVRRGSELIAGKGTDASTMAYGTLYEWQIIKKGKGKKLNLPSSFLTRHTDIGSLIQSIL